MTLSKLRRQIAFEAAQLMYRGQESEYYRAKMKAAKRICRSWVKPADLPSNAEIRDQVQMFARTHEGSRRNDNLQAMRIEALRMMRVLASFRPRLIGSVMTGHIRQSSDIDIHVFAANVSSVAAALDRDGFIYDIERKQVRKQGLEQTFVHIHVKDTFPFELTIYARDKAHYVFKSSITGKAIERASVAELEQLLEQWYPDIQLDAQIADIENQIDRFQYFQSLLLPLENVKQSPKYHPEGDALYHSLQVFDRACDALPYDEEFLLAALLHDVGKAIDADDHVQSGLEGLSGFISPRTGWLIAHHMEAHLIREGTIGQRAHRRLKENESYDELILLNQCDLGGREQGVETSEVEDALDYLRDLDRMCNG